jgi:hypothetical protein
MLAYQSPEGVLQEFVTSVQRYDVYNVDMLFYNKDKEEENRKGFQIYI